MTLDTLLLLCRRYRDLGDAVSDQLHAVAVNGESVEQQNPNAMRLALKFLDSCDRLGVDDALEVRDEIEAGLAARVK